MRLRSIVIAALFLPNLAVASLPPAMQEKVESLSRESDALVKERVHWEGVQQALLAQKQQIEDTQDEIARQQDALNARGAAHNEQAASQQKQLQRSSCKPAADNSDNSSGANVNGGDLDAVKCNKSVKKLNAGTAQLNADAAEIQAQQDALEAKYAKANQDASDWNVHESEATDHLNAVYRAINDWLDRAYPVIADEDFRDEVALRGTDAYCGNHGLPDNMSMGTARRLSDDYRRCLKSVLAAQRKGITVPSAAPHS